MDVVFQFIGCLALTIVAVYVLIMTILFVSVWSAFSGFGRGFVWLIAAVAVVALSVVLYLAVF